MNDSFQWWLIILGIGVGIGLAWLVMGRLGRGEGDVPDAERSAEAAWISQSIASYGGLAPQVLVEEILDLHRQYLAGPALEPEAEPSQDEEPWDAADGDPEDDEAAVHLSRPRMMERGSVGTTASVSAERGTES